MRIAIISDIHGNDVAFEMVLAAIERDEPDQIVCLGDVAANGPQPREALARLGALDCPVVMGNTDDWVLSPKPFTIRNEDDQKLYEVELWAAEQLTDADKAFIRTFQPTVNVELVNGRSLLCCHGSPRSYMEGIFADTSPEKLAEILGDVDVTAVFSGHTHVPLLRRFENRLLVNPGSVGLPFVKIGAQIINPPWTEYALVTSQGDQFDISLRRVAVDVTAVMQAAFESNMPHKEWWAKEWGN
ncbi:MAG: YfcE family phosphodiesterase [Chloroflexi bacterium]|nr:YfcE family phosphodiesterase [Chloroflexota bacterium]